MNTYHVQACTCSLHMLTDTCIYFVYFLCKKDLGEDIIMMNIHVIAHVHAVAAGFSQFSKNIPKSFLTYNVGCVSCSVAPYREIQIHMHCYEYNYKIFHSVWLLSWSRGVTGRSIARFWWHIRSDIEECEGWLWPGGHSSGGRTLTAKDRGSGSILGGCWFFTVL